MNTQRTSPDIPHILLSTLILGGLMIGSFMVLSPFLFAFIWSTLIVIPSWPLMLRIENRLGGKRPPAVLAMMLLLCAIVFIPVWLAIQTIVNHTDTITGWAQTAAQMGIPTPPNWVAGIPLIGAKFAAKWQDLATSSHEELVTQVSPYLLALAKWLPSQISSAGAFFLHIILTLLISVLLFWQGEAAGQWLRSFARALAGKHGDEVTILAAQAIKAVAMGIIVTALVQALVAWVGMLIAGVPYSALLTALVFILSVVQIGAWPVLIPTIIWLYWSGDVVWGTFFLLWSMLVLGLDNVLRPYLIKRGADLPLILIFVGVLGGLFTFGLIGLFIGPVILAVSYTLIQAWINGQEKRAQA